MKPVHVYGSNDIDCLANLIVLQLARCDYINPNHFRKKLKKLFFRIADRCWAHFSETFGAKHSKGEPIDLGDSPPSFALLLALSRRLGKMVRGLMRRCDPERLAKNIEQERRRIYRRWYFDDDTLENVMAELVFSMQNKRGPVPPILIGHDGKQPIDPGLLSTCTRRALLAGRRTMYRIGKQLQRDRSRTGLSDLTFSQAAAGSGCDLEGDLIDAGLDIHIDQSIKDDLFGTSTKTSLIEQTIQKMKPGRPRQVIRLFSQGVSEEDTCQRLSMTRDTYRQNKSRALREIRQFSTYRD